MKVLILEASDRLGGQLAKHADNVVYDYLGVDGARGIDLAEIFCKHIINRCIDCRFLSFVTSIVETSGECRIHLQDGESIRSRYVVIATGVVPRKLVVPGADLIDWGSPHSVTVRTGTTAAVVGGGDEACAVAWKLANTGADVSLLVRSRISARAHFRSLVEDGRVTVRIGTAVRGISKAIEQLDVTLTNGETIRVDQCFLRIGWHTQLPQVHAPGDSPVRITIAGDAVATKSSWYVSVAAAAGIMAARRLIDLPTNHSIKVTFN